MDIQEQVLNCLYNNILEGKYEESERLLEISAADTNELIKDKGISLLHLAAGVEPEGYAEEVVQLLLKYGGDPNTCSEEGMTALHISVVWGRTSIVKILLSAGANPHITDVDDKTPLDYALEHHDPLVLKCFDELYQESNHSPKKYSLQFDKILVRSGNIEGEYYPEDIPRVEAFRKSDYINEWFAKSPKLENSIRHTNDSNKTPTNCSQNYSKLLNSQQQNKSKLLQSDSNSKENTLYNTCLSSNIENETKVCKSYNESLFTTDSSYGKQQLKSIKNYEISLMSGVEPIETTSKDRLDQKDVNVTPVKANLKPHQNYESRTNIKSQILDFYNSKQHKESIISNWTDKTVDLDAYQSSSDDTQYSDCLNKAMVKCNLSGSTNASSKTINSQASCLNNGFVTMTRGKYTNTASFINDSFMPCIAEEYKYHDEEEGIALIEKRVLTNGPMVMNANTSSQSGIVSSISSVASSLPMSLNYDTDTLRQQLQSFGVCPGPITITTKKVYLKKLKKIRKNPVGPSTTKTYSIELEKTFRNADWNTDLSNYIALERQLAEQFETPNPNKKWREGTIKSSFTYLLLDPRISDNLPCKADTMQPTDVWRNFINSIFYIGKGKRSRPYAHLYDAVTLHNAGKTSTDNKKVETILNVWNDKCGVVCLHIFQNVIPVEAYTREAAMIEVIGLKNLKNIKAGNYYGSVVTWSLKQKKLLGVYLLYRAMLIFLSEGERQLRPKDIK